MEPVSYAAELVSRASHAHDAVTLDPDQWHVRQLELREAVDEPFQLTLTMLADDVELNVESLTGAALTLTMRLPESASTGLDETKCERVLRGVVTSAVYLGTFDDQVHMELLVRPSLALADLVERSRIFEHMTTPEVVAEVAAEHLGAHGSIDLTRLESKYSVRDYCVQFRETDLSFVRRILAEDGIAFVIEQSLDEDAQVMVLIDGASGFRPVSLWSDEQATESPSLPMVTSGAVPLGDAIAALELRRSVAVGTHHARAHDWLVSQPLHATVSAEEPAPWEFGEDYRHAFRRTQESGNAHIDETDRIATLLRERAQARSSRAFGRSNAFGFQPGQTFAVESHPADELNTTFLLTEVVHVADCPEVDVRGAGAGSGVNYTNRFQALPSTVPYRPASRSKPRAFGQQTATVVGPGTEEIHTDAYGRIKVWMHWDRSGPEAAIDNSCWLRVAQATAGAGFGTVFLPRVGMEVLVSFVDGDPDRPVCVGCLYNGTNTPHHPLPDSRTKTSIRTRSSPGGDGFNELTFEDKAGAEQVYLHAQRNLDERVGATHTTTIGASQSLSVGTAQETTVGKDQGLTVKGVQSITVKGEGALPPAAARALTVEGPIETTSVGAGYTLKADTFIKLDCGGTSSIMMTPDAITLTAGGGAAITLTGAMLAASSGGAPSLAMSPAPPGGPGLIKLGSGTAAMSIADEVGITAKGGASVTLDDTVVAKADGRAVLELSTDAKLSGDTTLVHSAGGKIKLKGSGTLVTGAAVDLQSSGGTVTADASGLGLKGTAVDVTGAAKVTIRGLIVGINE